MHRNIPELIYSSDQGKPIKLLLRKYAEMSGSPFRFFRGSCPLFYADLQKEYPFGKSPLAWICGDLHTENFGCYRDKDDVICFDMNDFDEAVCAPVMYELSRLAVSVLFGAREAGFDREERTSLLEKTLERYCDAIQKKPVIIDIRDAKGVIAKMITEKAACPPDELIRERTTNTRHAKLKLHEKLLALPREEKEHLINSFSEWFADKHEVYSDYRVVDAGFRIAGTGSIGVARYCILLEHKRTWKNKLLLDMKQAKQPILHAVHRGKVWRPDAQRVVKVQGMMQNDPPKLLSAFNFDHASFIVREIQATAEKVDVTKIDSSKQLGRYCKDLAKITAAAQLRSAGRRGSDERHDLRRFAEGYEWKQKLIQWAQHYARQVEEDHEAFETAFTAGFFNKFEEHGS